MLLAKMAIFIICENRTLWPTNYIFLSQSGVSDGFKNVNFLGMKISIYTVLHRTQKYFSVLYPAAIIAPTA